MAATLIGETLEKSYAQYTDIFRFIVTAAFYNLMLNGFNGTQDKASLTPLLASMMMMHRKYEGQYQNASMRFFHAFRAAETGQLTGGPQFKNAVVPQADVITNFMIHGPQAIQKKEALLQKPYMQFTVTEKAESLNGMAQQMTYKALEAPRDNMIATVSDDPATKRYIRSPNSGACDFCMMMVTRGPVYSEKSKHFAAHGNCGCSAIPVYEGYRASKIMTEEEERFREQYKGRETKARRANEVDAEVKTGVREKKVTKYIDKFGREATHTTYPKTSKGKQLDEIRQILDDNEMKKLKRTDEPYVKHDLPISDIARIRSEAKSAKEAFTTKRVTKEKPPASQSPDEIKLG